MIVSNHNNAENKPGKPTYLPISLLPFFCLSLCFISLKFYDSLFQNICQYQIQNLPSFAPINNSDGKIGHCFVLSPTQNHSISHSWYFPSSSPWASISPFLSILLLHIWKLLRYWKHRDAVLPKLFTVIHDLHCVQ